MSPRCRSLHLTPTAAGQEEPQQWLRGVVTGVKCVIPESTDMPPANPGKHGSSWHHWVGHRTCELGWCVQHVLQERCGWSLGCRGDSSKALGCGWGWEEEDKGRLCSNRLGGGAGGVACQGHTFVHLGAPLDGGPVYQLAQAGALHNTHYFFTACRPEVQGSGRVGFW